MSPGVFAYWPNRITAVRFVGALLLFLIFAVWGDAAVTPVAGDRSQGGAVVQLCFWLFIVLSTSDALDGYLARRNHQVTAFGRIADPFVDKILVLGTMMFLAVMPWSRAWFPMWIVVVVLSREFLVTGIRGYVESLGLEFPSDWFGKIKMIVQCVAIGAVLGLYAIPWPDPLFTLVRWIGTVCVWGTLVTAVGSGASYVMKARELLASPEAKSLDAGSADQ